MISVTPRNDLIGISEIRFVENFDHPKSDHSALAHYLEGETGKKSVINFHIPNIIVTDKIPEYVFESFPEIAGLFLSEIFFHEVGHHAHRFQRHSVKKNKAEKFADSYAKAGYFNYLKNRRSKILNSYLFGSLNFFTFNKKERAMFKKNRQDLIAWLNENTEGIGLP